MQLAFNAKEGAGLKLSARGAKPAALFAAREAPRAMDPSFRAKIEQIADRHEELGAMLCEPEVVNDKPRFLKVSREHADLNPVAEAFARYLALEGELDEAKEHSSFPLTLSRFGSPYWVLTWHCLPTFANNDLDHSRWGFQMQVF